MITPLKATAANLVLQKELRVQLVTRGHVSLLQHGQLLQLLDALGVLEGLEAAQHLEGIAQQSAEASQSRQGSCSHTGTGTGDLGVWRCRPGWLTFSRYLQVTIFIAHGRKSLL